MALETAIKIGEITELLKIIATLEFMLCILITASLAFIIYCWRA